MAATAANPFPYWQPTAGIDFSLGKMLGGKDAYKIASNSNYQDILKNGLSSGTEPAATLPPTGSALPKSADAVNYYLDVAKGLYPLQRQMALDTFQLQQEQNRQGFADAYPWVSQAGREGRAGNLAASKEYQAFVQSQPTSVQNIMVSKQAQMASAAGSEAERARAIAAQTQAAKDFAGRYTGQTFSVG